MALKVMRIGSSQDVQRFLQRVRGL